ncbi:MAG: PQQ-like beta-propeller repeat protein [Opitutales bacterium]|nr:PQQ-like beta-propeller repeat protein [Opitutales bacterium]
MNIRIFLLLFLVCHPLRADVAVGPLEWVLPVGGAVFSSPATCGDGRVYFGTEEGLLLCVDPAGGVPSVVWTFDGALDWIDATPLVTPEGLVVFGSWDGKVYALDKASGEPVWTYQTGNYIMGSPAVAATGEIIIGGGDGILHSFTPSGELLWVYIAEDAIDASPAVADGIVYVGDSAGVFHAVRVEDGDGVWTFEVEAVPGRESDILSSAAVGPDGTVYFGSRNHRFHALSKDGVELWSFEAFEPIDSSPAVSPDGTVAVGSREGYLFVFDADGVLERQIFTGDVFYASPAYDADGNLYIGAYAGDELSHVLAIGPDGDYLWAYPAPGFNDSSPLVSPDGNLYVGMHDFSLYAFDLDGAQPQLASWAAFRDNPRRSGRRTGYYGLTNVFRLFPSAQADAGHWYWLGGFGSGWFHGEHVPWLYHPDHGHLWAEKAGAEGVWLYDESLGWLYTFRNSPHNFYYQASTEGWIYHEPGTAESGGGRWIYHYGTGTWEVGEG